MTYLYVYFIIGAFLGYRCAMISTERILQAAEQDISDTMVTVLRILAAIVVTFLWAPLFIWFILFEFDNDE